LGRGGATTFQQDLANADCILIMGSNFAECHPVGFRFVMRARERGARIIHVDPRFTRTSAMSSLHVPIRAGSDIAFLGGLINHVLHSERWRADPFFREYVVHYTNAAVLVDEEFRDAAELGGVFSGWDDEQDRYDPRSWEYEGTRRVVPWQDAADNVECRQDADEHRETDPQPAQQPPPRGHGPGSFRFTGTSGIRALAPPLPRHP